MKKKTINAIICKKFDEWLNSITDDNVKNLVNSNSLITGGCIASMLLQEEVNDFDIYFTNKETVLAVSNYYVEKFKSLHVEAGGIPVEIKVMDGDNDDHWAHDKNGSVSLREKGRVKIYLKSAGVAGEEENKKYEYFEGSTDELTEEFLSDVFNNVSKTDEIIATEEINTPAKYRPVFLSANAITLSDKIQLIIRFYGEPSDILLLIKCFNMTDLRLITKEQAMEMIAETKSEEIVKFKPYPNVAVLSRSYGEFGHIVDSLPKGNFAYVCISRPSDLYGKVFESYCRTPMFHMNRNAEAIIKEIEKLFTKRLN